MDYTTLEFLDTRTDGQTDGWTDRRGSQNSYLDIFFDHENFERSLNFVCLSSATFSYSWKYLALNPIPYI